MRFMRPVARPAPPLRPRLEALGFLFAAFRPQLRARHVGRALRRTAACGTALCPPAKPGAGRGLGGIAGAGRPAHGEEGAGAAGAAGARAHRAAALRGRARAGAGRSDKLNSTYIYYAAII